MDVATTSIGLLLIKKEQIKMVIIRLDLFVRTLYHHKLCMAVDFDGQQVTVGRVVSDITFL